MTTTKQTAANRRNALQSTGPRTARGKARSSLNATTHGLLAVAPVLTHVETPEAWEAHRDAVVAALEPVNHLESILVERIALQAWRLGRVARHEAEKLSLRQDRVDAEVNEHWWSRHSTLGWPNQAEEEAEIYREVEQAIKAFLDAIDKGTTGTVSGDTASWVVIEVARVADLHDGVELGIEGIPEDAEWSEVPWTGETAWQAIRIMAGKAGKEPHDLVEAARHRAFMARSTAEKKRDGIRVEVASRRADRLVLGKHDMALILRYEAHLERSMYRSLHELQRLQAARSGGQVTAPVAVDVSVAGGG